MVYLQTDKQAQKYFINVLDFCYHIWSDAMRNMRFPQCNSAGPATLQHGGRCETRGNIPLTWQGQGQRQHGLIPRIRQLVVDNVTYPFEVFCSFLSKIIIEQLMRAACFAY